MRLQVSLVLPIFIGAVQAASETAKVYIFQEPRYPTLSTIPTLTPEEARLVIAQRLGISRYHSLSGVSDDALTYINAFGGPHSPLFTIINDWDKRSQLVLMIDNVNPELAARYENEWASIQPAFKISSPPLRTANLKLVQDLHQQNPLIAPKLDCGFRENFNPFNEQCWPGRFKLLHLDPVSVSCLSSPEYVLANLNHRVRSHFVQP
jgi:hypothetical protein